MTAIDQMIGTTVTAALIGSETAQRTYVKYEIAKSLEQPAKSLEEHVARDTRFLRACWGAPRQVSLLEEPAPLSLRHRCGQRPSRHPAPRRSACRADSGAAGEPLNDRRPDLFSRKRDASSTGKAPTHAGEIMPCLPARRPLPSPLHPERHGRSSKPVAEW
jgi:hypothetical protein